MSVEIVAALFTISGLLLVGTVVFRLLEKWSWVDAFYFSVVTLATVGYGDLAPKTEAAKLFTAFYILFGTTAALAALGIIGASYLEKRGMRVKEKLDKMAAKRRNGKKSP